MTRSQDIVSLLEVQIRTAIPVSTATEEIDWGQRAIETVRKIVPLLVERAETIAAAVEARLNSPLRIWDLWLQIRDHVNGRKHVLEELHSLLESHTLKRETVTGDLVSTLLTIELKSVMPDLISNGRSDYPDLYLQTADYSDLPMFCREPGSEHEYGASLKGAEKRPVRIPDGLEIKTCRRSIRVDCHHPHVGLHLVLVFDEVDGKYRVKDLAIAFLAESDYRESKRNTTATTVKYSFNGTKFISLLLPSSERANRVRSKR